MDFAWSEEHQAVRDTVCAALDKLMPQRDKIFHEIHRDKRFPQEIWDVFTETGMFGALLPEQYGGSELGLTSMVIATEEAAARGFGNTIAILTTMDSLCILRNGSEELKQEFLPKVAEGKLRLCFALTEPDAGSNTFRLSSTAKADGDDYVINGQKTFITGIDLCDYVLVPVRTTSLEDLKAQGASKAFGLSLFMVPTKAEGITLQHIPTRGIEGMNQYTVFFDNVRVDKRLRIGEEGMGTFALNLQSLPGRIDGRSGLDVDLPDHSVHLHAVSFHWIVPRPAPAIAARGLGQR